MSCNMKRLLDLIEFKSRKTGKEVAKEDFDCTRQHYSRMKSTTNKWYDKLVQLARKYNMTDKEVMDALRDDYEVTKKGK